MQGVTLYCHLFEVFAEQVASDPADARDTVQRPLRARPRPRLAAAQQELQELARAVNVRVRDLDQSAMSIQQCCRRLIGEIVQSQRRPILGPSPG